jgi:hypothetical protein
MTDLLACLYFAVGLMTASSYALLMGVTTPGVAAAPFSAFMGATNGCESCSGYTALRLVAVGGYGLALRSMAVASLLTMPLLLLFGQRDKEPLHAPADADL